MADRSGGTLRNRFKRRQELSWQEIADFASLTVRLCSVSCIRMQTAVQSSHPRISLGTIAQIRQRGCADVVWPWRRDDKIWVIESTGAIRTYHKVSAGGVLLSKLRR